MSHLSRKTYTFLDKFLPTRKLTRPNISCRKYDQKMTNTVTIYINCQLYFTYNYNIKQYHMIIEVYQYHRTQLKNYRELHSAKLKTAHTPPADIMTTKT